MTGGGRRATKRYRTRMRICRDILDVVRSEGGAAGPTRILYGANLSHERMTRYLADLMERGLLEEEVGEDGRTLYRITERGLEFLREFRKVERFASAFGFAV